MILRHSAAKFLRVNFNMYSIEVVIKSEINSPAKPLIDLFKYSTHRGYLTSDGAQTSTSGGKTFSRTVELRSDTFTQPSRAMREAMVNSVVGDDVFGDD